MAKAPINLSTPLMSNVKYQNDCVANYLTADKSYKSLRDCRLCEVGVCDYAGAFAKRHLPAMRLSRVGC